DMRTLSRPFSVGRTCAIVATLTTSVWTRGRELAALRGIVSGLEIRADLTGDLDPDIPRSHIGGELVYCLRSAASGGAFASGQAERTRRLLAAARKYDLVDLELDTDLTPELLDAIPPHRRRLCWYGPGRDAAGLAAVFGRMAA